MQILTHLLCIKLETIGTQIEQQMVKNKRKWHKWRLTDSKLGSLVVLSPSVDVCSRAEPAMTNEKNCFSGKKEIKGYTHCRTQ